MGCSSDSTRAFNFLRFSSSNLSAYLKINGNACVLIGTSMAFLFAFGAVERIVFQHCIISNFVTSFTITNGTKYPFCFIRHNIFLLYSFTVQSVISQINIVFVFTYLDYFFCIFSYALCNSGIIVNNC